MSRGEINVDPVHDEFFKAQDLADALVREAIQNSLDARRGNARVRVRFRFGTLPRETAQNYLRGLEPHVALPRFEAMPFLVVEDSGTRGLIGDPGEDPELDDNRGSRNDFYYFWRNIGRSGKGELDRGRWGLGKAVFPVSSRIHAMFGVTHRADDNRILLLGQTVLKTHVIDGRRFAPYGFFATVGRDDFPHALEDAAGFLTDFSIERDEPGLSIVIPFYREEDLSASAIIASVIRQYFYPITKGDLTVIVGDETITGRTIEREASDESLARRCALARWSMAIPESEWIDIPEPQSAGAPKWDAAVLGPGSSALGLEALRARFEHGDRLAFRVHLSIRRKKHRSPSHFDVVLEKDESLKRGEHHFIRRGITIPEVRAPRDKPVRALLVADDEPISTFLGDAENPAHSDWSERNDRVRILYEHGPSTLRYVKNAIARIAGALTAPPAGLARDLLSDIFSIPLQPEDGGEAHKTTTGDTPAGIAPRPQAIRITPIQGGFTIQGLNGSGPFIADVAYRTRNGDPFRRYSPFDFSIGRNGVLVRSDGATVKAARGNRIAFETERADFQLTVSGFDPRRDLVVRVARQEDNAPEAELH